MIQLYSLMWILAIFFAIFGFMRGWNRDLIATAGILLGMFVLFQFDFFIRGILLRAFPPGQAFFIQAALFLIIVFYSYQNTIFEVDPRDNKNIQAGILGAFVGFLNGYLIGGTLWYFLDINEYPLSPYVVAPAANSPSANAIGTMPIIFLSGGVGGTGELLVVAVVLMFLVVFFFVL